MKLEPFVGYPKFCPIMTIGKNTVFNIHIFAARIDVFTIYRTDIWWLMVVFGKAENHESRNRASDNDPYRGLEV
jgi:hypothetical protein